MRHTDPLDDYKAQSKRFDWALRCFIVAMICFFITCAVFAFVAVTRAAEPPTTYGNTPHPSQLTIDPRGSVTDNFRLKLQANNLAELSLLTGLESDLTITRAAKDSALKETATVKAGIANVRGIAQKALNRVAYLEPKYAEAVGLLWKWRCFAIGTWVLIAGLIAAKIYLKAWLPFL